MKLSIKKKLQEKGITRYELAKRIGVTYPTITAIYNGESTSIKLEILEAICRELDCTPLDILIPEDTNVLASVGAVMNILIAQSCISNDDNNNNKSDT